MVTFSAGRTGIGKSPISSHAKSTVNASRGGNLRKYWVLVAGVIFLSSLAVAQNAPQVTAIDPSSGKVNDTVTVSGSNLGKDSVSSVFLSDDKSDFKAAIVDQSEAKITVKVPQVKAGDYNVSVQVGDKLFIKPVKFKVAE